MYLKRKVSYFEFLLVVLIISIVISAIYKRYNYVEFQAKKELLKIDLRNINLAVQIFKFKYGRFPKDLYELKEKDCLVIGNSKIISQESFFKNRKLMDPFGNYYIYDNKTGKVKLSEKTKKIIKRY